MPWGRMNFQFDKGSQLKLEGGKKESSDVTFCWKEIKWIKEMVYVRKAEKKSEQKYRHDWLFLLIL